MASNIEQKASEQRSRLAEWVKQQHSGQKIKGTQEPYFSHVSAVAELSEEGGDLCYEIGLCHDLLEDTSVTSKLLNDALRDYGYKKKDRKHIITCVVQLTDKFTKDKYPDLRKKERKEKEAERLLTIEPDAQTVKYADLIYNTHWVLEHDKNGAKKYLNKKLRLLAELNNGDVELRNNAIKLLKEGLRLH